MLVFVLRFSPSFPRFDVRPPYFHVRSELHSESDHQAETIWAKKEEENAELQRKNELRAQLQEELHPSRCK